MFTYHIQEIREMDADTMKAFVTSFFFNISFVVD